MWSSIGYHHKYWIYQTIWQAKLIKFIIKLFTDHDILWVKKHATHEKVESLTVAFLLKLDNTINKNSIFNTKYAEFFTKQSVLLHFHNLTCANKQPCNLHQKIISSTSVNFYLLFSRLLFNKIILTIHMNTPFDYTAAFFHLPIFAYNHSSNLHQKCFPYLSHLANSGCV